MTSQNIDLSSWDTLGNWFMVSCVSKFQRPSPVDLWTLKYVYNLIYKYQYSCNFSNTPCDLQAEYKQVDGRCNFELSVG
jgi:hypothetical protein